MDAPNEAMEPADSATDPADRPTSSKNLIAAIAGVLLVGTLATLAIIWAVEDDGPGLEHRVAALEHRMHELEGRDGLGRGPHDLPGLDAIPRFGDDGRRFRLRDGLGPEELQEFLDRFGLDRSGLRDLFGQFEGRGPGFGPPGGAFRFDPGLIDELQEQGILDEEQADQLRDAFEQLREALGERSSTVG